MPKKHGCATNMYSSKSNRRGILNYDRITGSERAKSDRTGKARSKTQAEKMQVGVDSFAAQFMDNSAAAGSVHQIVSQLVERIELADQVI